MFNRRTISVIKREFRTHLLSKSFIIMTLLVPVFLFGIMGIQTLLHTSEGDEGTTIIMASESPKTISDLEAELGRQEFIKNGYYKVSYEILKREQLEKFINEKKIQLIEEKLSGIIFIPDAAEQTKEVGYYSKNPKNNTLFRKLDSFINKVLVNNYFENKFLSESDISFATGRVDFKEYKISDSNTGDAGLDIKEEGYGNMIISFLFTFLLYFSLVIFGSSIMQAVIEEKNNRIIEVLLSSLNSSELLTGKIIGTSVTGLIQMGIWLLPVFVLITTTLFVLPVEFSLSISPAQLIYFLLNYFVALLTFVGLYAAVGSIFNNAQDAQSGMWPILMLIMIPFFIAMAMQSNPNNSIAKIASMVPFASLIVMPARITIMQVPVWQFILSIFVNIGTLLLTFTLAGKVYRVGILSTGKKPKWSEVAKWLKYKY